jgi:hypothetical protein
VDDDRALIRFDAASAPPGLGVTAGVRRSRGGMTILYRVQGGSRLDVPEPVDLPQRADRLWEHTCFEAFLAPAGGPAYWELDLSPSGDWNLYRFAGYRDGMEVERRVPSLGGFRARSEGDGLRVEVVLDLGALPELTGDLNVGLAAVLEAEDGTTSYWGLRHVAARPDFHRRGSFVLPVRRAGEPA